MLKQNRERMESIPNYNLPVKDTDRKYSGMPRHLHDIFQSIKRAKEEEESEKVSSLPLEHWL